MSTVGEIAEGNLSEEKSFCEPGSDPLIEVPAAPRLTAQSLPGNTSGCITTTCICFTGLKLCDPFGTYWGCNHHSNRYLYMSRSRRPWGVIAGPIIFFGGLMIFLGVQKAQGVKEIVQDWGHELEHSAAPVVMDLPVYVPLFVGGDWLGRLETIVVDRTRPGAIDSLQLFANISDMANLAALENCSIRIRPPRGELSEFKSALRCVNDTKGMLAFGHLDVNEADLSIPLFVLADDLPCEKAFLTGPCSRIHGDMQAELQELAEELRASAEEFRVEAERIKRDVRVRMRERLRGIR